MDNTFLVGFVAVMIVVLFFVFAISLVIYILHSIGLYRLAKNKGMDNAWLAWIPIGNYYILGAVSKQSAYMKNKVPKVEVILPIVGAVYVALSFVPAILNTINSFSGYSYNNLLGMGISTLLITFLGLCFTAFITFVYYHIYKTYEPNNAVLYTILSVFSLSFIFIFVIRNKQPVLPIEGELIQQ
ncbi:MAG: hypothetical protein KAQ68_06175 [Clostridiales bacterium]|nr:hypothetical protein [Clostridiales bacterium]